MNLPSTTHDVALNDLLYKPTKILRKYIFSGFYLIQNTASKHYIFDKADNIGIKLVLEFNKLKIGIHDLADLQQEFYDSYQTFNVLAFDLSSNSSSVSESTLAKDIESFLMTNFQLTSPYGQ